MDKLAFCLIPIFTKFYFLSNKHFCDESTPECELGSRLQLLRTKYIIHKHIHIWDMAYPDIFLQFRRNFTLHSQRCFQN